MTSEPASAHYWSPSTTVQWISKVLLWVIIFTALTPLMRQLAPLTRHLDYRFAANLGLLAALALLALVLHELGHFFAARACRSAVIRVQIGPLVWLPQRGRSFFRWVGSAHWLSGGVQAIPRLDQSFRAQLACLVAGGPLANLVAAVLSASTAWAWVDGAAERLLYAFSVMNLLLCVGNLLPTAPGADGTQLLRLAKGLDLGQPGTEVLEANMRAYAGQGAEDLPESLVQGIEREMPPVGHWFRLFAAVRRDDWEAIQAVEGRLQAWEAMLDRASRDAWFLPIGLMRAEIGFARGLRDGTLPPLPDQLRKELPLHRPGFLERHDALRHALAGRWDACRAALVESEREAAFNVDPVSSDTEARQRARVSQLMAGETPPSPATV